MFLLYDSQHDNVTLTKRFGHFLYQISSFVKII